MTKYQNNSRIALLAGTAALASLVPQGHAQSSDALIEKLVAKGILTANEAKDLRNDSDKDFKTAFSAKTGMPDWVTGYKFSGDFRGRYDHRSSDNTALVDRDMLRYRLRVGLTINMNDDLQVGFRLGSGDSGKPLSNNQTLSGNASKKPLYVDTAYGKWTALNDSTWLLSATLGKMDNPLNFTPMVFDPDLTPEGGAIQGKYTINDKNNLTFAAAGLVLDEVASSTRDPFLYGGQVAWNSKWSSKLDSSVGVGALQIVNNNQLGAIGGNYTTDFNPVIGDASLTYTLDKFPLYPGKFPIKLAAEYMNNPAAAQDNSGYWAGVTFGKSGKKHTWDLSYRYEYLEAKAWYNQLVDDDNAVFIGSFTGGTNVKGHLIKWNYSIFDSLSCAFTCYINDAINAAPGVKTDAIHAMADIMWKF